MLADAVEASTRSIDNPTVQKIEDRIDELVKARFMEGQLDECDLTLRDITRIKVSFAKILTGIHHSRMQYPEQQPAPAEPGLQEENPVPLKKESPDGKRPRGRRRTAGTSSKP